MLLTSSRASWNKKNMLHLHSCVLIMTQLTYTHHMVPVVPEESLKLKWFSVKGTERGWFLELLQCLRPELVRGGQKWSQNNFALILQSFIQPAGRSGESGGGTHQKVISPFHRGEETKNGCGAILQYCINLKTTTIDILLHKFLIDVANTTRLWYRIMKSSGSQCVTIRDVTVSSLLQHMTVSNNGSTYCYQWPMPTHHPLRSAFLCRSCGRTEVIDVFNLTGGSIFLIHIYSTFSTHTLIHSSN